MHRLRLRTGIARLLLFTGLVLLSLSPPRADNPTAVQLEVDDAIGPATADYLKRSIDKAAEQGARVVIIRMDTPGGLDKSMRDIVKNIINSPLPVITYVSPSGARAASAGTYILYASHIAAMAPGTNLGAATPVQIGGPTQPAPQPDEGGDEQSGDSDKEGDKADSSDTDGDAADKSAEEAEPEPASTGDAKKDKMINDAVAYIRSLAQMRERNADWAEKAVREAASLPANEALEQNVIDFVAASVSELLEKVHGETVMVMNQERELNTKNLVIEVMEPDWRSELLAIITNPTVAYFLMLIGFYGIILEFYNPGTLIPGTIGAISILLALYAFQILPVNYAGAALILLGLGLMVAEAFAPSFGILGIGGVIAFIIGSIILMDTDVPGFGVSPWAIGATGAIAGALTWLLIKFSIKAFRNPVVSGEEEMVGKTGTAVGDFDKQGTVFVHSENWQARTRTPLRDGQRVRVVAMEGLTLEVEPIEETEETS